MDVEVDWLLCWFGSSHGWDWVGRHFQFDASKVWPIESREFMDIVEIERSMY